MAMKAVQRSIAETKGLGKKLVPDNKLGDGDDLFETLALKSNVINVKQKDEDTVIEKNSSTETNNQEPELVKDEPVKEVKEPKKRGRRPAKKEKVTLNVCIDKDVMDYIEYLMETNDEHKSMVVNKKFNKIMREDTEYQEYLQEYQD